MTSDFERLTTLDNLFGCWLKAKRNKGSRLRIQRFQQNALHYLVTIQERLRNRTYQFGPYQTFTVREKKWREVVDAPMKDRIVHWMLYEYLLPIWQPRFIHDTFGNLPNRGTHAAVKRLAQFTRQPGNQWVLQLDISKYFHSVPHQHLAERAVRYVGDHHVRQLIQTLISTYRTGNQYDHLFAADSLYRINPDKGMPIGNLSSQLFANIYLNEFDHWIKETLRIKAYIRYVDDMVILGESKEQLQELCQQIIARLASEGITIHPKKIRIAPVSAGIPFLGYVTWPNHISAGAYLRRRYLHALRQHESGIYDRSEALNSYRAASSYTGHISKNEKQRLPPLPAAQAQELTPDAPTAESIDEPTQAAEAATTVETSEPVVDPSPAPLGEESKPKSNFDLIREKEEARRAQRAASKAQKVSAEADA